MTETYFENVTTLKSWGNSQAVRIPKVFQNQLDIKTNDELIIKSNAHQIIIEKAPKKNRLEELFENYNGDYKGERFDWGLPVGREIW